MRKFLLPFLLLPFPATAEVYLCTEQTSITLVQGVQSNNPVKQWLIDTEKGFKYAEEEDYLGNCDASTSSPDQPAAIHCTDTSTVDSFFPRFVTFTIYLDALVDGDAHFSYFWWHSESSVVAHTSGGRCQELML